MRGGRFVRFAFQSAGVTVPTIRKQLATFRATGVKVGVKGFRATGASIDLAFSDQCVAVILAAGIDRPAADFALGHRSVPKEGRAARRGHRAARREQYIGCSLAVIAAISRGQSQRCFRWRPKGEFARRHIPLRLRECRFRFCRPIGEGLRRTLRNRHPQNAALSRSNSAINRAIVVTSLIQGLWLQRPRPRLRRPPHRPRRLKDRRPRRARSRCLQQYARHLSTASTAAFCMASRSILAAGSHSSTCNVTSTLISRMIQSPGDGVRRCQGSRSPSYSGAGARSIFNPSSAASFRASKPSSDWSHAPVRASWQDVAVLRRISIKPPTLLLAQLHGCVLRCSRPARGAPAVDAVGYMRYDAVDAHLQVSAIHAGLPESRLLSAVSSLPVC